MKACSQTNMKKSHFDTNYLIRYFTNDIPSQNKEVVKQLTNLEYIWISPLVIAETIYILENHYHIPKHQVCPILIQFFDLKNCYTKKYTIIGLKIYQNNTISFYDSLILAETLHNQAELKTFDKKLESIFNKLKSSED